MSTLISHTSHGFPISANWLDGLKTRIQQYRAYHRTLNALMDLTDHELMDLGLDRSGLKRVAYQAAYDVGAARD